MSDYYIGRQAIFNRKKKVVAYELLFRSDETTNVANVFDAELATSQVILNSYLEKGLEKLVGHNQAYINLTKHFIHNKNLLPPPDNQLVLEILEDLEVTDELIEAITDLKKDGYKIALDDFHYDESLLPLIELADIIKVDILNLNNAEIEYQFNKLRGFDKILLAEKVETYEELELCIELGFDLFQGFFLSKPRIIKGKRLPSNHVAILHLLSQLLQPDITVDDLGKMISHDVSLSHKLLKYINSAAHYKKIEVNSIRDAVMLCGVQTLKNWAMLIALASADDKPNEVIEFSLIRAKMCDIMAQNTNATDSDTCFTIGLLSMIDAIMDQPLEDIIKDLPLSREVKTALLNFKGSKGSMLKCTVAYEHGDWDNAKYSELSAEQLAEIYIQAVAWAETTVRYLAA